MRVGVDGRSLVRRGGGRGIALYAERMVAALAAIPAGDDLRVLLPGRAAVDLPAGAEARRTWLPGRALYAAQALLGRPRLDRLTGPCDVTWAPSVGPLALSRRAPFVLTVPDLSFELRPDQQSAYERAFHRAARPRALGRRADWVIAMSETVRERLIERWGLDPARVVTIAPGPGRPPGPPGRPPAGLPESYVLAVGALEPRKQPAVLARAHALARERGLRAGLVFAGDGPLRAELDRGPAVVLGRVGDAELDALYAGAMVVACVSSDEGFGFTPLEALARGTPALVSDLAPFRETMGDAAVRVPAGDPSALATALLELEDRPERRTELVAAGADAVAALSWERAAAETRAVLAQAADE